jgi:hypothetical protein
MYFWVHLILGCCHSESMISTVLRCVSFQDHSITSMLITSNKVGRNFVCSAAWERKWGHTVMKCVCGNGTLLCVKTQSVAIFLPHLQAYKLPSDGKHELNLVCKYYWIFCCLSTSAEVWMLLNFNNHQNVFAWLTVSSLNVIHILSICLIVIFWVLVQSTTHTHAVCYHFLPYAT